MATPTGSGKSLVAAGAHFAALAEGRRSFYTAPIKALVSEKFFDLCHTFGREHVGMMTGDAAGQRRAPIICCTAEILANIALRGGDQADVGQAVMDEFHFYADPDRGWAWQVPLLTLPQTQMVLMSATLGDVTHLEADITRRTGRPPPPCARRTRPVPLDWSFRLTPVLETIEDLLEHGQAPVYIVHFTQASAIERAQQLMSTNLCTREEKDRIAELIGDFRFSSGFGKSLSRFVRSGVGVHHAGMLPKYRRLVERLVDQASQLWKSFTCANTRSGAAATAAVRETRYSSGCKATTIRKTTTSAAKPRRIFLSMAFCPFFEFRFGSLPDDTGRDGRNCDCRFGRATTSLRSVICVT